MKKLLKTITFLSLIMCLTLNASVVYAAKHPKCKKSNAPTEAIIDSYVHDNGKGALIYTMLLPHDEVEKYAKAQDENDSELKKSVIKAAKGLEQIIKSAATKSPLIAWGNSGDLAEGIAKCVTSSSLSNAESWVLMSKGSSYCGVKVYYWKGKFIDDGLHFYRAEGF